jgi:hypothetical protein
MIATRLFGVAIPIAMTSPSASRVIAKARVAEFLHEITFYYVIFDLSPLQQLLASYGGCAAMCYLL